MADSKAKKGPIRIPDWLLESLKDEQYALRKSTGQEPPYGDLLGARIRKLEALERQAVHGAALPTEAIMPSQYRQENKSWHDMLERILTEGTERLQLSVQTNIEALEAKVESPHRKRKVS